MKTRNELYLAGLALLVKLGKANPLAELLALDTLDDADRVLLSEGLDKADVLGRVAVRSEDAKVSLATVQRLDALAEAASNAIVHKGLLQGGLAVDIASVWKLLCNSAIRGMV